MRPSSVCQFYMSWDSHTCSNGLWKVVAKNAGRAPVTAVNINHWWGTERSQDRFHGQKSNNGRTLEPTIDHTRFGIFISAWESCVPLSACPSNRHRSMDTTTGTYGSVIRSGAAVGVAPSCIPSLLAKKPGSIAIDQKRKDGTCKERTCPFKRPKNSSQNHLPQTV